MKLTQGQMFLHEIGLEEMASRECLKRMKSELFDWKPHEKSMQMGYLALLVADMPRWINGIIDVGVIDFATWERKSEKSATDLVKLFNENIANAKKSLEKVTDEELLETFSLKNNGQLLMSSPKGETILSSLNHWVHHRGRLTVYMRLNNIPVPSIYGPSADSPSF